MTHQRILSKNWVFTSFNLDIDWEHQDLDLLNSKQSIKYLIYQGEYTKEYKKHIQGYIQFNDRKDMTYIKRLFKDNTLHLERARGTPQQASDYCKKTDKEGIIQETFFNYREYGTIDLVTKGHRTDLIEVRNSILDGEVLDNIMISTDNNSILNLCVQYNRQLRDLQRTVKNISEKDKVLKEYEKITWNEAQQAIINIIENDYNNPRAVYWVYDKIGDSGKTYLLKYYLAKGNAYIVTGGKQADILYNYQGQPIIFYDLARTYADNMEHIYTTIENFKNGCYLSTKYITEQRIYDIRPVVIIMSNFLPDTSKLSKDRWRILMINPVTKKLVDMETNEPPKIN